MTSNSYLWLVLDDYYISASAFLRDKNNNSYKRSQSTGTEKHTYKEYINDYIINRKQDHLPMPQNNLLFPIDTCNDFIHE